MSRLTIIKNDVFDIADRVKSIDEGYFIAYNHSHCRFEVHHSECKPSLQLIIPYKSLDKRTVDYVMSTRRENSQHLIDKIDAENHRLARANENNLLNNFQYKTKSLIDYYDKGGLELVQYNKI